MDKEEIESLKELFEEIDNLEEMRQYCLRNADFPKGIRIGSIGIENSRGDDIGSLHISDYVGRAIGDIIVKRLEELKEKAKNIKIEY